MHPDPIVEEVRKAREAYAAQFDYDLEAIFRDLSGTFRYEFPAIDLVHRVQLALLQRLGAQVADLLVLGRGDHLEEGLATRVFDQRDEVPALLAEQR